MPINVWRLYHGTAPAYLTEFCHVCNDERLRSTQRGNFAVVRTRTRLADGSFTVAGPADWNSLLYELRKATYRTLFLSHLKTYFHNKHFDNTFQVFKFCYVSFVDYRSWFFLSHFRFITACLSIGLMFVVYCGASVLQMRDAVAVSDVIWYDDMLYDFHFGVVTRGSLLNPTSSHMAIISRWTQNWPFATDDYRLN